MPWSSYSHLAEHYQDGDHRCGLEIDRDGAIQGAERRRKEGRHDGGDNAVGTGDASAHGDQREHVEIARLQPRPAAHKERPASEKEPHSISPRACKL